jgi:outer membrane protein assembly factor BamB
VNGLVFVPTSYGVITCLDCETGEILWIHEFDEGFYSSPVAAGNHIYILDMKGRMNIFKAAREFALISQPELGEDTMATPAFVRGRIYIRGEKHLFCIGEDR